VTDDPLLLTFTEPVSEPTKLIDGGEPIVGTTWKMFRVNVSVVGVKAVDEVATVNVPKPACEAGGTSFVLIPLEVYVIVTGPFVNTGLDDEANVPVVKYVTVMARASDASPNAAHKARLTPRSRTTFIMLTLLKDEADINVVPNLGSHPARRKDKLAVFHLCYVAPLH